MSGPGGSPRRSRPGSAGTPRIYGHRGSRRPGPDNTPGAVQAALAAGADGVEIDIRRIEGKGALVLAHDLPVGGEPALTSVLDLVAGRGRVVCEVKNRPGQRDYDAPTCRTARLLIDVLAARPDRDEVIVSSFDWHSLAAVRATGGPSTAFLTPPGVAMRAATQQAVDHGHREIHVHWTSVTARGVRRAHDAGLAVVVWPIAGIARARRLAALDVDGLICDDPAEVVRALHAGPGEAN